MKSFVFSLVFVLMSLSGFAQRGFPTSATITANYSQALSTEDRIRYEGMPMQGIQGTIQNPSTTLAVGAIGAGGGHSPQPGIMWIPRQLTISTKDTCEIVVQQNNPGITPGSQVPPYAYLHMGIRDKWERKLDPGDAFGQTGIYVSLGKNLTKVGNVIRYNVWGRRVSYDFDKEAERIAMLIGDSYSEGSTVSKATETYQAILVDSLEKATKLRWRIVNKSKGGFRTSDAESMRHQGGLFMPYSPNLIVVALGTNDATVTDYTNNMNALLPGLMRMYPRAAFVLCTPATRTDASGQETVNVAIRTAAANLVTTLNSPRVKLARWEQGWNSTNFATYMNGDKIHANAAGHIQIANITWATITANNKALLNLIK